MKVLLMWVLVSWVTAVFAERTCVEYCVYVTSGGHKIKFQPGCDCMHEQGGSSQRVDDSGIYYEPANYIAVEDYIRKQPFHILNPLLQGKQIYPNNNNPVISEPVKTSLNTHKYNNDIGIDIDNTHFKHNRQEKNIQSNNRRFDEPLYLDISVVSDDEQLASTNTFNVEDLKLAEQSLLECTDLHSALDSRKNKKNENNKKKAKQYNKYGHYSNDELTQLIDNKCAHVSYVLEKSLNEIKDTRSKANGGKYRVNSEGKHNNEGHRTNYNYKTTKSTFCTTEHNLPSAVNFSKNNKNLTKEHDNNKEQTIIIYADQNISNELNTLSSNVSITTPNKTIVINIQASSDITTGMPEVFTTITEKPPVIYKENQYPLFTKTVTPRPTTPTFEFSTSSILDAPITVEPKFSNNIRTDREFMETNNDEHFENRSEYKETDLLIPKIITHEFNNNTVQSFINGTENLLNNDFTDEMKSSQTSDATKVASQILPYHQYTGSMPAGFETSTPNTKMYSTVPNISGNLYFVFNNHQIPAKFVQNINGSLHLGIDGISLCNKLTQNHEYNSTMITALCNCYKSGNYTQKDNN